MTPEGEVPHGPRSLTPHPDALVEDTWEARFGVLPWWRAHDGWDGAAGCEMHQAVYEPYPYLWDRTLACCQINHALRNCQWDDGMFERPWEDLDPAVTARVFPALEGM